MSPGRLSDAVESLRFRRMVWWGRVRFRLIMLGATVRGLPRQLRMRLGRPPRRRRASVLWNPESGGWRICPSGVDSFGIGHEQLADEVALAAPSDPAEVVAALRAALARSRYLDPAPAPMSDREWKQRVQNHLMVSALEAGGSLGLTGWRRLGRGSRRRYEPVEELAGSLAADAPPAAVYELLRRLLDRVAELESR